MKAPKLTIPELSSDSARFMEQLQAEPDRGAALVGAAALEPPALGQRPEAAGYRWMRQATVRALASGLTDQSRDVTA
jgi:hypothetical protein